MLDSLCAQMGVTQFINTSGKTCTKSNVSV